MSAPISAFIVTKNEETRLRRTLAALRPWVDEIVLVDSGSSDRTADIARSMGARVFCREWNGYGNQKRFAEQQCRNDWVLNVDADEVITPGLADEICALFDAEHHPEPGGYRIRILTVYPGDEKPRPFAHDYNVVRLYHKAVGHYRSHAIFDRVMIESALIRQLLKPIYHYSYVSLAHIIEKNNNFSTFRTEASPLRSRRSTMVRLWFEFPFSFVKSYFFRRHCTGGWKGFYFSLCYAFLRTTMIAKMLERASSADKPHVASVVQLPRLNNSRRLAIKAAEQSSPAQGSSGAHTF
jgi:glycosyltransferase involved in cell wall biosynthesis